MARWKLLEKGNVKFPHSKLYTLSEKSLYHQRYSTDFQEHPFCWRMWKRGISFEKIMSAAISVLQCARWKLLEKGNVKVPHSKLYTASEKTLYHQRYSNDFEERPFCWRMWKIVIWEDKSHERSYFSFAIAKWKLFSSRKIWNFPLSNCALCTLCQKKCYITKGIQPILKNIPAAEGCGK